MIEYIYLNFIERSPIILWGAFFIVGMTLEKILPVAVSRKNSKSSYVNISHALIYLGIIFLLNLQFIAEINKKIDEKRISSLLSLELFVEQSLAGFVIVTIFSAFLLDFVLYWWHRAEHTIPFLWDIHAVHHSDEQLNAFSSTREIWFEAFIRSFFATLIMKLGLGVSNESVVVAASLFAGINFVNHCNIRFNPGPLYRFIATPQFERIHHSIELRHQNRNFSGIFSIWDCVFGTLYIPEKDEYPETGVKGTHIDNVTEMYLYPVRKWRERLTSDKLVA